MKEEEIRERIEKEDIKIIKLIFTDLLGELKTVEIWAGELERALKNKVMIDGSNIVGLSSVDCADMILCPDIESFRRLPFYDSDAGNVAGFMCDISLPDGEIALGCMRSNLKKGLKKMHLKGFDKMNVAFEPEFFIFKNKPVSLVERSDFIDFGAYDSDEGSDEGAKIRREIMYEFDRVGIKCLTGHHECSPSQFEITNRYSDAVSACDNIILIKLLIRAIAKKHGLHATFMPKPISNMTGSGLHTNISLTVGDKNIFSGNNGISDTGVKFISGVLRHAAGLCLLTNPTINSYKRLISGFEAPVNICWSVANRSAMIRVPKSSGEGMRIEIRNVDATCNPYLAVAGILAAGLDGIEKNIEVPAIDRDVFGLSSGEKEELGLKCLPLSLDGAIAEFEADGVIKNCLSSEASELLLKIKKKEVYDYIKLVNSFDIENYF